MHMIFSPFMINSVFHFNRIALFKINWRLNALRYARSRQAYWPKGGACTDKLASPIPDRPKTSAVSNATLAVSAVFHVIAPSTILCTQTKSGTCTFALSEFFGSLEIVKDVEYLISIRRQNVL